MAKILTSKMQKHFDEANVQGLPNPTKVIGTVQENAKSAKVLEDKVSTGNMVTAITSTAVAEKGFGGAVIKIGQLIGF